MRGGKTNFFSSNGQQQKVGKSQKCSDGFPSDFLSNGKNPQQWGGDLDLGVEWRIGLIEFAIRVLNDR